MISTDENKQLVVRFFSEVWNGRKMDLLADLLQFPYEIENLLTGAPPQRIGREEMDQHLQEWFAAFPDLDVSIRQVIAEGDQVFAHTWYSGAHLGAYHGVEPSGNRIGVSVLAVFRAESGRLVGHTVMVDALGLYQQLGWTLQKPTSSGAEAKEAGLDAS